MRNPRLAVIAFPNVYASAIAHVLRSDGGYDVEAPDILSADWAPATDVDVVIASLPVSAAWARVVISLPEDFADGLAVSIGAETVLVAVDEERPLHGILAVVDRVAADPSATLSAALLGMGLRREPPTPTG